MPKLALALALALAALPAGAQELTIHETPYDEALAIKPVIETFEAHAGQRFQTLQIMSGQIGQMLRGQTLLRRQGRGMDDHWVLDRRKPDAPLALDQWAEGSVAAVVRDGAFGSQALAGIGPEQLLPGRMRLGSGLVTVLFDQPQCMFGLTTWLDGQQDNIVMRSHPEGNLNLIFWRRDGHPLAEFKRFVDQGPVRLAYIQSSGGGPEILAVTIQNLDPEGIGIDEIIYSPLCPMLVSEATSLPGNPGG
jgi:hypothetical protein